MTGRHARQIRWLTSGYDLRVHAFYAVDEAQGFLEALCGHSVSPTRVADPEGMASTKCMDCLLAHGTALADEHGDSTDWGSR